MRTLQRVFLRGFFLLAMASLGVFYLIGIAGAFSPHIYTQLYLPSMLSGFVLLCIFAGRQSFHINNRQLLVSSAVAFILLMILQCTAARVFLQEPAWDPGGVFVSAKEYVEQGRIITHIGYLERFPNNCGLFLTEVLAFSVLQFFGISITMFHASLMNLLFIDAALIFMLLFVQKVWGNKKALLYLILSFFFTPYTLYVPVVYTDTISMVFNTAGLYLFACLLKKRGKGVWALLLMTISLLLAIGMKIKGNVTIILVAMLIYLATRLRFKRFVAALLLLTIPFTGFLVGFDTLMKKMDVITQEEEKYRFPTEYWIYMGLQGSGGFFMEDFERIIGTPGFDGKQQVARDGIKQRLEDYGRAGLLRHISEKVRVTYRDGTYYAGVKLSKKAVYHTRYHDIFTASGKEDFQYFRSVANAYHIMILILLVLGLARGSGKRRFDMEALLYLALFGLGLFLLVWETRSRYLVNFTPLMLALAAKSLLDTGRDLRKVRHHVKERFHRKRKLKTQTGLYLK